MNKRITFALSLLLVGFAIPNITNTATSKASTPEYTLEIERDAANIMSEFLDPNKKPDKFFGDYVDEIVTLLKGNTKYNRIKTKLISLKREKTIRSLIIKLLNLKNDLPKSAQNVLKSKKATDLQEILTKRWKPCSRKR